jgi:hypothetical protein
MDQTSARDLARQILDRDLAAVETTTAAGAAAAAELVFHRLADNLVRWVGSDGSQALFTRARSLAQARNLNVKMVPPPARSALFLDALAANSKPHDTEAVMEGAVTILAALLELLTRLVGDDLAVRLLFDTAQRQHSNGVRPPHRPERKP